MVKFHTVLTQSYKGTKYPINVSQNVLTLYERKYLSVNEQIDLTFYGEIKDKLVQI